MTTTTTTQFDSVGRPTDVFYNDGTPNKNFAYDLAYGNGLGSRGSSTGQLTGLSTYTNNGSYYMVNARGYRYDIMGRVSAIDDCLPDWCGVTGDAFQFYGYDYASEITSQTHATGQGNNGPTTVSYAYNPAGQLTSVSGGRNSAVGAPNIYSATLSTMQPGGPQFVTYGNNVTAYTTYDIMNRTSGKWLCGQPGGYNCPNNSTYFYGYYANQVGDQVKSETDTVVGDWTSFYYDAVGNLSTSSSAAYNAGIGFSAGYDRYGNRWSESVTNTPSGLGPNQSLSFNTAKNQIQGYVYDAVGNLINDTVHTYQYDAENNMISVDGGATATFTFDALNQRDKVVTSDGVDRIAFDVMGRRFTTWQDGYAYVKEEHYYNGRRPLSFFSVADNQIHFEHQNWIGTERMRTDQQGNRATAVTFASLPFGEPSTSSGSDLDPSHFAELDQDGKPGLGLHHAAFREYSSIQGRWMASDPLLSTYHFGDPQTLNRYSYARNNPLVYIDPDGTSGENGGCINTSTSIYIVPSPSAGDPETYYGNDPYWSNVSTSQCTTGPSQTAFPSAPHYPNSSGVGSGGGQKPGAKSTNDCSSILTKGAVQTGLDALSMIPGEGDVALAFYGGKEAFQAVQVGTGLASTGMSIAGNDSFGTSVGATGAGIAILGKYSDAIKGGAEAIPVLGQLVGLIATAWDVGSTIKEYRECIGK